MADFTLYTDGGGNVDTDLGAACIVDDIQTKTRYHLGAYLGKGSNNEAEVISGILGISVIMLLNTSYEDKQINVKWYSDSEYTLFGATKYTKNWLKNGWKTASQKTVKNQALWKTILELRKNPYSINLTPIHVKGHSGHLENELCDTAATWIRKHSIAEFNNKLLFIKDIRYKPENLTNRWLILNAMSWLRDIRNSNDPENKDILWFIKTIKETLSA